MNSSTHYDAVIVGGGPAGLTAAIYLSRSKFKTLLVSEGMLGGQMVLTHEIANYPGVENISGYQLSLVMKNQAKKFGAVLKSNIQIKSVNINTPVKEVVLMNGERYTGTTILLTPGGRSRTLGVEGEADFKGRGVSYCATCDGDFFTGKEIFVVGGGNSALEEAVSLTKYASKVTIVHQFDTFQAFPHAIEAARKNDRIEFMMQSAIVKFNGGEKLESVDVKDLITGNIRTYKTDGTFIFIGYVPNTEFLKGMLTLNQRDEIEVNADMETSIAGVYAAGDSIAKRYRQVTTAVGDATIAALAAAEYVTKQKEYAVVYH